MGIIKKIKKEFLWIIAIILLTFPVYTRLIQPGFFPMQDDLQAFRVYEMDRCFDDLQIPCRWVPNAGYQYGYPQFNYYPPSVYYIGAAMHRLGVQYIDTIKILFWVGYLVSAIAMFVLVRAILGNWPGFVASILYTYIPYKAVEVYVRGALNEFWSLAIFPLIFWALYELIKTEKKKYFIWLAVSIGLLLITHNLMTLIFAPFAIAWAIFWLVRTRKWRTSIKAIASGLLGLGLAAFFFLPVLIERKFVHVESLLSGYFDYRQHFVSLYRLFLSREWGYGSSGFPNELLNLSTGLIQWVAGLVAVGLAILNYKKKKEISQLTIFLGIMSLAAIFMIHMKSSFIWARIPVLWWLQFPWRFLSVVIFLLSALAALMVVLSGKAKYVVGSILIILAIVLNIGFFTPKGWLDISDKEKFSGILWEKQLTISIFDYLPIYAKLPPPTEAPALPEILDGSAKVSDYSKGSNYQKGKIEVIKEATVRLPLFDFPGMKVTANGEAVKHYHDDCRGQTYCLGLITFKLTKGSYDVEARLTDTPIRVVGNYLSLTSIFILIWLIIKKDEKLFK